MMNSWLELPDGRIYRLEGNTTLGRHKDNDLVLADPSGVSGAPRPADGGIRWLFHQRFAQRQWHLRQSGAGDPAGVTHGLGIRCASVT